MNLSPRQKISYGENAGAVPELGPAHAAPAHFQVGAVGFGPGWTMEDSMAASIVRLEQENEELRAEVALLREEQKILAKGFPSPAKPHFSDTPETDEAVERWRQGKINIFDEMARLERERDEARDDCERLNRLLRHETALGQGEIDHWAALERERDEAREALRDMLSGWKYIRSVHGDLYGVGWDRAQSKAETALEDTK